MNALSRRRLQAPRLGRRPLLLAACVALFAAAGLVPASAAASGSGCTSRLADPVLAVVGASFSAGVGAGGPERAWPAGLGRILRWPVAVSAESGAGYLARGITRRGPFSALVSRLDLRRLHPAVLLIQGGHNDIGRPAGQLDTAVYAFIAQVHDETPGTRIGVVTVFAAGDQPSAAAIATDRVIVTAARRADPGVMVFDPLVERWRFPRDGDHLHPTVAGHEWIATTVAAGLRANGVTDPVRATCA
jgi:lysophospholipase L1-like esterase